MLRSGFARRLLDAALTLLGVAITVFVMLRLIPGDQITAGLGTEAAALTPGQKAALVDYYGLDEPWYRQFFSWLGNVLTGNLGYSSRAQESVAALTRSSLPITLELAVLSMVIALLDRHPARDAVGVEAALGARRGRPGGGPRRPVDPGVPARHHAADGAGVVAPLQPERQGVRHLLRRPVAQPPADTAAGRGARLRHRRADHAHHAHGRARGALDRLRADGARQGRAAASRPGSSRAAQRRWCRSSR